MISSDSILQIFVDAIDNRWKAKTDIKQKLPKQLVLPYTLAKEKLQKDKSN